MTDKTYTRFLDLTREYYKWDGMRDRLEWYVEAFVEDDGAAKAYSELRALIGRNIQNIISSEELSDLIEKLDKKELKNDHQKANFREMKRVWERKKKVDPGLVEKIEGLIGESQIVWREARKEGDFSKFEPYLEKMVEYRKEFARQIDPDRHPYEVLMEEYEPGLTIKDTTALFEELRRNLVPIIKATHESDNKPNMVFKEKTYDKGIQKELAKKLAEQLGFDYKRGNFAEVTHPFMLGVTSRDVSITTKFDEEDPLVALLGTAHETGHGLYEQGQNFQHRFTPAGRALPLGMHESQSRFWENHIGRTPEFWNWYFPQLKEKFPEQLADYENAQEFYKAANEIEPDLIRIEANEATYNLHIAVRFEIEKGLLEGSIKVKDLPKEWNQKMRDYLGVKVPDNGKHGVLQDIHWAYGMFGYFPSYTIGTLNAAQIWEKAKEELPDLEEQIGRGEFGDILKWSREKIHSQGSIYEAQDLMERVTGSKTKTEPFINYIRDKAVKIYDLKEIPMPD